MMSQPFKSYPNPSTVFYQSAFVPLYENQSHAFWESIYGFSVLFHRPVHLLLYQYHSSTPTLFFARFVFDYYEISTFLYN